MRFNSTTFLAFLALVVIGLWLLPARFRKHWLLLAGFTFYGSWQAKYLGLLFGVAASGYFGGRWILSSAEKAVRKQRGFVVIGLNVFLLALFKYLDWFVENVNGVAGLVGADLALTPPGWILPLGISFYIFQNISYLADCVKKKTKQYGFWEYQLFIGFFPQLIAGPIMRAKEFFGSLETHERPGILEVRDGIYRISTGLFYKIVLADSIALQVDAAFAKQTESLASADVIFMTMGFALQMYFDFASYSHIAIGAGKLCGIDLVENFKFPFSAQSPSDFWNRWHMSLSRWVRDYLYFPLLGRRLTLKAMCKASVIGMTICGLWHGANWTFVVWGFYLGVLLAANYAWEAWRRKKAGKGFVKKQIDPSKTPFTLGMVFTSVLLFPGWLLFRASSLSHAGELLFTVVTPWANSVRSLGGTFYLHVAVLMMWVWLTPYCLRVARETSERFSYKLNGYGRLVASAGYGSVVGAQLVFCTLYFKSQTTFIYFQF